MFEARNAAADASLKFNRNGKPEGSCFEELFLLSRHVCFRQRLCFDCLKLERDA